MSNLAPWSKRFGLFRVAKDGRPAELLMQTSITRLREPFTIGEDWSSRSNRLCIYSAVLLSMRAAGRSARPAPL